MKHLSGNDDTTNKFYVAVNLFSKLLFIRMKLKWLQQMGLDTIEQPRVRLAFVKMNKKKFVFLATVRSIFLLCFYVLLIQFGFWKKNNLKFFFVWFRCKIIILKVKHQDSAIQIMIKIAKAGIALKRFKIV